MCNVFLTLYQFNKFYIRIIIEVELLVLTSKNLLLFSRNWSGVGCGCQRLQVCHCDAGEDESGKGKHNSVVTELTEFALVSYEVGVGNVGMKLEYKRYVLI